MRFIFMLLTLLLLAEPVLAKSVISNTSACQNMYRDYMNAYNTGKPVSKEQMAYFFNLCMPENSANNDEAYHRKLLQNKNDIKRVVTVRI